MSFENPIKQEAKNEKIHFLGLPEESKQFPGSKIVKVQEGDRYIRYALRRDSAGVLEGNEFELQEYKDVPGTSGGFWDSSDSMTDAEGEISVNGQTRDKYRIGPTYQLYEDKLKELEAAIKEQGWEI